MQICILSSSCWCSHGSPASHGASIHSHQLSNHLLLRWAALGFRVFHSDCAGAAAGCVVLQALIIEEGEQQQAAVQR
jgi:hypothetical protein